MSNVKRLIEVDLPIRRISDAARAGRSRRSGNLSALHYWWARRPTAACRSLALATMLPDPLALAEEEHERALEPRDGQGFLQRAAGVLEGFLPRWVGLSSGDSSLFLDDLDRNGFKLSEPLILRRALLEFIADFAIEENAANEEFIAVARSLTRVAHAVLNPVTERPLIIDPFAGGGAIPVECVRVGADVVASDLNPVSVLLNKVLLEGGARGVAFAERVERWGDELLRRARAYLGNFYPKDEDGATPIAYLWARTLRCTGPGCGKTIPLIGNLQVTKRRSPPIIARVTHENGETQVTLQERPPRTKSQEKGTVRGGVVHCPFCGFSTEKGEYRQRAANGELGEQMFGVVLQYPDGRPRKYRTPTERDIAAFNEGAQSAAALVPPWSPTLSPFPDEPLSPDEPRRLNVRGYGYTDWGSMFNSRQSLALATFGGDSR